MQSLSVTDRIAQEIKMRMSYGFSLEVAANQVSRARLGRHDAHVKDAVSKIELTLVSDEQS